MPKILIAQLRVSFENSAIEPEAGIIRGVKVMELGKLAKFAAEDGTPKSVKITDKHISALLAHAGNRAIPSHLTHDWFSAQGKSNADSVEMAARIGALKNFRKDESGDLIADAFLKAGKTRDDILWGAEHNPEDNMLSAVYGYAKDDPQCLPLNFKAVDFVPTGAATTALFSETPTNNSMDINELIEALKDPKAQAAVSAIIKSHKADADEPEKAAAAMEQDPAMMSALGITDADKKESDKTLTACLRLNVQTSRAIARQTKELAASKTAILAEAKVQSEAATTALLGKGGFIGHGGNGNTEDAEAFITAQMSAGCKSRAAAILRMAKDKPDIYALFTSYDR